MRRLVVGLLTLGAGCFALVNLGALWKLMGLPYEPGAGNLAIGCAVAFLLAIVGTIGWAVGTVMLDDGKAPAHLRPPPPPFL